MLCEKNNCLTEDYLILIDISVPNTFKHNFDTQVVSKHNLGMHIS